VHDRSRQRTPWNRKPQRQRSRSSTRARETRLTQAQIRTQPAWPLNVGTIRGGTQVHTKQHARAAYRNIFAAAAAAQRHMRNPQRGGTQQVNSKTPETHRIP